MNPETKQRLLKQERQRKAGYPIARFGVFGHTYAEHRKITRSPAMYNLSEYNGK